MGGWVDDCRGECKKKEDHPISPTHPSKHSLSDLRQAAATYAAASSSESTSTHEGVAVCVACDPAIRGLDLCKKAKKEQVVDPLAVKIDYAFLEEETGATELQALLLSNRPVSRWVGGWVG